MGESRFEEWSVVPPVTGGVVVGHDGSAGADAALRWALADAGRRGCAVHVVRAWMLGTAIDDVPGAFGTVPSMNECASATLKLLEEDVDAVLAGGVPAGVVEVARHAVHGPAGPALVSASQGADLLVVGHRGRGHLAELLLGSVAEYALRHAHCSVTVVRT